MRGCLRSSRCQDVGHVLGQHAFTPPVEGTPQNFATSATAVIVSVLSNPGGWAFT